MYRSGKFYFRKVLDFEKYVVPLQLRTPKAATMTLESLNILKRGGVRLINLKQTPLFCRLSGLRVLPLCFFFALFFGCTEEPVLDPYSTRGLPGDSTEMADVSMTITFDTAWAGVISISDTTTILDATEAQSGGNAADAV